MTQCHPPFPHRRRPFARNILRACLMVWVVLALSMSAFAHQPSAKVDTAQTLAYVLAGGDMADLCGDMPDAAGADRCLACVIGAAAPLPAPATTARAAALARGVDWPALPSAAIIAAAQTAHGARAPPAA